jgi:Tfp pilus assembly protein PilV
MANKTFKIGERARGGVITAETKGNTVTLIAKQWDTSAGYTKKSSQTNAKELHRITVDATTNDAHRQLFNWMCEESTAWWADEVLKWVATKVSFKKDTMW